jgi:hypothetical protein
LVDEQLTMKAERAENEVQRALEQEQFERRILVAVWARSENT